MFKASEGVVDNLTWNNIKIFLAIFWFVAIGIRVKRDRGDIRILWSEVKFLDSRWTNKSESI